MDTVASICASRYDFSKKDDIPVAFLDRYAIVSNSLTKRFQLRHLVIMGGEERPRPQMLAIMDIFRNRPGDAQTRRRCWFLGRSHPAR